MKKTYRILFVILLFLVMIMVANTVNAIDTSLYNGIYADPGTTPLDTWGSKILGVVQVVAAAVAVCMVTWVGVKYIMASPSDKADLKGQLIMVTIGAVLIFGGAKILVWVINTFNNAL